MIFCLYKSIGNTLLIHNLLDINDTHFCQAKAVDNDIDTEVFTKSRRYGGTAVFWRKEIDRAVNYKTDGNECFIVLTLNTLDYPLCIINSDNKNSDEQYIDTLA